MSAAVNKVPAEPDPDLVECAIAAVLAIAKQQGITSADIIRMLDSGMQMSDFLKAIDQFQTNQHMIH